VKRDPYYQARKRSLNKIPKREKNMDLMEKRMRSLVKLIGDYYVSNPDSNVYSRTYITNLAECMAKKIVYGVRYTPDIESQLTRLNWRS
jgi:hypothetical protein